MTTPTGDPTSPMLTAAENMLASRIDVIRPLAEVMAERKRLQGLLDDVEKAYGAAYAAAEAGGWTPGELRQMGADEPTRRPQGRPKGSRTRQTRTASVPAPSRSESADGLVTNSSSAES